MVLVLFLGAMNLVVGKRKEKLMGRILSKKMKNLWNLKRKGVEKENLEKKKEEFKGKVTIGVVLSFNKMFHATPSKHPPNIL